MTDNPLKGTAKKERVKVDPHDAAAIANAHVAEEGRADEIEWVVLKDGGVVLRWLKAPQVMAREALMAKKDLMDRRGLPMSESDTYQLNKELEKLGAKVRYLADGSKYSITAEAA